MIMKKAPTSSDMLKGNSSINPIDDPKEAIDFFLPLPNEVYKKWVRNSTSKRG